MDFQAFRNMINHSQAYYECSGGVGDRKYREVLIVLGWGWGGRLGKIEEGEGYLHCGRPCSAKIDKEERLCKFRARALGSQFKAFVNSKRSFFSMGS